MSTTSFRKQMYENVWKHGKIVAIVEVNTGKTVSYDYMTARNLKDYFADPEQLKKYDVILIKNLPSASESELKAKFVDALGYLSVGMHLQSPEGRKNMMHLAQGRCSYEWMWWVNEVGYVEDFHIMGEMCKTKFQISAQARPPAKWRGIADKR